MFKEFKEFIARGNAMELAVGVVIGAAFGKIVDSLVSDVIMPPIGLLTGQVDFSNAFAVLREGETPGPYTTLDVAQEAGAVVLGYGAFLNTILQFVIVAFAIFLVVKAMNKMRAQKAEEPATPAEDVVLLGEIRDLLKSRP